MTDQFANSIVFLLLLTIIICIVYMFNSIYQGYFLNIFLSKIKNISGNYSSINIILMFVAILSFLFLLYWAFKPKLVRRESQFRSKD